MRWKQALKRCLIDGHGRLTSMVIKMQLVLLKDARVGIMVPHHFLATKFVGRGHVARVVNVHFDDASRGEIHGVLDLLQARQVLLLLKLLIGLLQALIALLTAR